MTSITGCSLPPSITATSPRWASLRWSSAPARPSSPATPGCWKPTAPRCRCARPSSRSTGCWTRPWPDRKATWTRTPASASPVTGNTASEERAYGDAEVLFSAKNTSFEGLQRAGVLAGGKGKVRLTRRDELDPDWNPATDRRVTDWESAQHLTRSRPRSVAAGWPRRPTSCSDRAEKTRALAYRLYALAERRRWAEEAHAYNILVTSWPQIRTEAARLATHVPEQAGFGFSRGEAS